MSFNPEILDITYFDTKSIAQNSIVLILGKRGSGKTTVAENIMEPHTYIKEGICISKTDKMNGFWGGRHIPQLFVHHEYHPSITENLFSSPRKKMANS